jgi:hypothetical protein
MPVPALLLRKDAEGNKSKRKLVHGVSDQRLRSAIKYCLDSSGSIRNTP